MSVRAVLLVSILVLSSLSLAMTSTPDPTKSEPLPRSSDIRLNGGPATGWGEEMVSQTVTVNGSDWTIRGDRDQIWWRGEEIDDLTETAVTIDAQNDSIMHICGQQKNGTDPGSLLYLRTGDSPVRVDSGDVSGYDVGAGCDIEMDPRGRVRISYLDATNGAIKVAMEAAPSSSSPDWLVRRINTGVSISGTPDLVLFLNGSAAVVWREANSGGLRLSYYTSTYWAHETLTDHAVESDFVARIDSLDRLHVLHIVGGVIHDLTWPSGDTKVVDASAGVGSPLAVAVDTDGTEQLAYTAQDGDVVRLVRSLEDRREGRIDPTATVWLDGGSEHGRSIASGDLNGDGLTDVVIGDSGRNGGIGAVDVHMGSYVGLDSSPHQTLTGSSTGDLFGAAVAILSDIDGDGRDELLIGAPGAGNATGASTGTVEMHLGAASLATSADQNWYGRAAADAFGASIAVLGDVNLDGLDDWAVLSRDRPTGESGGSGLVDVYHGSAEAPSVVNWTRSGTGRNLVFGQSMAAVGDIDGDGAMDFAVGSAGGLTDLVGYGRVDVYRGSAGGLVDHHTWEMNQQGTLFGYSVVGAGDLNGDGYDDIAVGEPLNSSDNLGEGKAWLFAGGPAGSSANPNVTLVGGQPNMRLGTAFGAAGDIDGDGFDDLFLARPGGAGGKGEIMLQFGSGTAVLETSFNIWSIGANGTRQGTIIQPLGDSDGDGQVEWLLGGWNGSGSSVALHEHRDFEAIILTPSMADEGGLVAIQLAVDMRGRTHLVMQERSLSDATPSGWRTTHFERPHELTDAAADWIRTSFDGFLGDMALGHTGLVTLVGQTGDAASTARLYRQAPLVVTRQTVVAAGSSAIWPTLSLTGDDTLQMLYVEDGTTIRWMFENATGLQFETITTTASPLVTQPLLQRDSSDRPVVVWRDPSTDTIRHAVRNESNWTVANLSLPGDATSDSWAATVLSGGETRALHWNGTVHAVSSATIGENGTKSGNLSVAGFDSGTYITIAESDWIIAGMNPNGSGRIVTVDGGGSATVKSAWNTSMGARRPSFVGQAVLMQGEISDQSSNQSVLPNGTLRLCEAPYLLVDCTVLSNDITEFDYLKGIRTTAGHLVIASTDQNSSFTLDLGRGPRTMPSLALHGTPDIAVAADGTVHLAALGVGESVVVLRLLPDSDRDLVPDVIDSLPTLGGQWNDGDGDGWGDHVNGPSWDACDADTESSRFTVYGCPDLDDDGYANIIDDCFQKGYSYRDRTGCRDHDGDGWSTNDGQWTNGDRYTINWLQARDSDGDGLGDNHGPDCCGEMDPPDAFPHNKRQWADKDGDGWGDNSSAPDGDKCVDDHGTSIHDRGGCLDSDGDGYSDPQDNTSTFSNDAWRVEDGADRWPWAASDDSPENICGSRCHEQWWDVDGDGWGDNSTPGAWRRDAFPTDPAQWNDTDFDGYGDNYNDTSLNGTRMVGIYHEDATDFDDCPLTNGNSTRDLLGCLDTDGDGHSNIYTYDLDELGLRRNESGDALPDNPDQFRDKDGDGFGDIPQSLNGDLCPSVAGVAHGTPGAGCPAPIEDADGDLIGDADDLCPDTGTGQTVDENGCAWAQRDDDVDAVMNPVDLCQNTTADEPVDANGCSDEQLAVDTDGDGVGDVYDACPDTDSTRTADANGCAANQRDTDGDGVDDETDQCADTSAGATVDEVGCYIAGWDSDGDGYEDASDAFPADSSQWLDIDGDGFGDNLTGNLSDACVNQAGDSSEDRLGCVDTDGDGWSDGDWQWLAPPLGTADAFPDESSQWRDRDGDGFGDNQSEDANNSDDCPDIFGAANGNAGPGCPFIDTTDSDGDGVYDTGDLCADSPVGVWVDSSGCTEDQSRDDQQQVSSSISLKMCGGVFAALIGLLLIVVVIRRLTSGRIDFDDEDDEYDDDYDDADPPFGIDALLSSVDSAAAGISPEETVAGSRGPPLGGGPPSRSSAPGSIAQTAAGAATTSRPPGRVRQTGPPDGVPPAGGSRRVRPAEAAEGSGTAAGPGPPSRKVRRTRRSAAPVSSDPYVQQLIEQGYAPEVAEEFAARAQARVAQRGPPGKTAGPPTRTAGPPAGTAGPAAAAPSRRTKPSTGTVRRSASWDSLFEPMQRRAYDESVETTRRSLAGGEEDRLVMRTLQRKEGWTARQSRHILEDARS